MKTSMQYRVVLLVVLGSALITSSALAQDPNAYLYIAHAASGRAVSSTTNPALPIDVNVNGVCIAKGISYGEIQGPFSGPAGTYSFWFTNANSAFPCTGSIVFAAQMGLSAGTTYYGALYVNASHGVFGAIFGADLSPVSPGQARVVVINTTQDTLSATMGSMGMGDDMRHHNAMRNAPSMTNSSLQIPAGTLQEASIPAGIYQGSVTNTSGTVLTGPLTEEFTQRNVYLLVLGGSTANQSVQVIGPKVVSGDF